MGRDRDLQFEWVNAWAESSTAAPVPLREPKTEAKAAEANAQGGELSAEAARVAPQPKAEASVLHPLIAPVASAMPEDQLMRDIAEIERVRDALAEMPLSSTAKPRMQAFTLVPSRTSDPVPVVIGGVLALVMLTVFGAAAAMTKLAR